MSSGENKSAGAGISRIAVVGLPVLIGSCLSDEKSSDKSRVDQQRIDRMDR
jgi:hypothetical protein